MQDVWYDKFSKRIENEKITDFDNRIIIAILKKYCLLKQQKNSTANVLQRGGKSYYTILADALTEAVNQWNIPQQ